MATYTEGIRKLYESYNADNFETTCLAAEKADYSSLLFNGVVWFKDLDKKWIKTCLTIEDFQAS